MIIVKLIGGLGNQLFQYALGRHLADIHGTTLKIDITGFETYKLHKYSLGSFRIIEDFAAVEEIEELTTRTKGIFERLLGRRPKRARTHIREKRLFHFNKRICRLPDNVYLDGYWQSEKYFRSISGILRDEFVVKDPQQGRDRELADIIATKQAVSVHIRRADYVTNEKTKQVHGLCSLDYYSVCMDRIAGMIEEPHFFVFSDDPEWARQNLKHACPITVVDQNGADKNYEDLRLMSQCRHHIIANSSFSWWGAWLNARDGKIVFAPKVWYAKANEYLKDVTPAEWIRI